MTYAEKVPEIVREQVVYTLGKEPDEATKQALLFAYTMGRLDARGEDIVALRSALAERE